MINLAALRNDDAIADVCCFADKREGADA